MNNAARTSSIARWIAAFQAPAAPEDERTEHEKEDAEQERRAVIGHAAPD